MFFIFYRTHFNNNFLHAVGIRLCHRYMEILFVKGSPFFGNFAQTLNDPSADGIIFQAIDSIIKVQVCLLYTSPSPRDCS